MRLFKRARQITAPRSTEAEMALRSAVDASVQAELDLAEQRDKLALAQADAADLAFAEALISNAEHRTDVTAVGVRVAVTGLVLETLAIRLAARQAEQVAHAEVTLAGVEQALAAAVEEFDLGDKLRARHEQARGER